MEYQKIIGVSLWDVQRIVESKLEKNNVLELLLSIFGIFKANELPGEVQVEGIGVIWIFLLLSHVQVNVWAIKGLKVVASVNPLVDSDF